MEGRLLDLIYDAASEPALFDEVLRNICAISGTDGALIEGFSHRHEYSSFHHDFRLDPGVKPIHEQFYMRNPWADHMVRQPVGRLVTSEEIISLGELKKTGFYTDILQSQDLAHSAMSVLAAKPDFTVALHFMRTTRKGVFDERSLETIRSLVPHLRRSLDLRLRIDEYAAIAGAELDALDLLANGVILLSETGRAVFVNRSAEAMTAGNKAVLRVTTENGVTGGSPLENERFRLMVDDVLRGGPGGAVRLSNADGHSVVISVAPLRSRTSTQLRSVGIKRPAVALFLSDPSRPRLPTAAFLCEQYGLTSTEAKVALGIGSGTALASIAETLGMTINTLKTHARRIYQKTGTRGQPDLVQRMAALAPPNGFGRDGPG